MTIDILCKVVDNYGDIGVAYRLAKALSELDPNLELRLVVDGLASFASLLPEIDPEKAAQRVRGWTVVDWNKPCEGFLRERPRRVVECFACGRPDWLEAILFDPADAARKLVLNLEYLTAEPYAREFHLLRAATRSPLVTKFFFMPGFEAGTGGLVVDGTFREARARFLDPRLRKAARLEAAAAAGLALGPGDADRYWVSVFGYERDYARIVADLAAFAGGHGAGGGGRPILALVAKGRSEACFLRAWEEAGQPFPSVALPFLPQEAWDELLLASDFAIVRGEESLARAALSGRPFLWQAYVQESAHQLVKVKALLERMRPCFPAGSFALLEELFIAFNDRLRDTPNSAGEERLLPVLEREAELRPGFERLSAELFGLGNLAEHLLTFFRDFV